MADNVTLDSGTGGSVIRTDDDGTAHWQYVKLAYGADNTRTIVTSTATNPLPVALSDTDNAVLDVIAGDTTSIDGKITACNTGAVVLSSGTVTTVSTVSAVTSLDKMVHVDDAAFTLGTHSGVMIMGFAGTQSVNANDAAALACDTDGALHIADGGNSITVDNGGTFATQATLQAGTAEVGKLAAGTAEIGNVKNAGTFAVQSTLQAGTAEIGKLAAGTAGIGKLTANSGVDIGDVDVLSIAAGTALIGDVGLQPRTSGGVATVYRDEDIDETAVSIKASAGQVYWIHVINLDATPVYLHLWDVAVGSVTVGTTGELASFCVPSQGDANGAGFTMEFSHGIAFGTEITVACTTTISGTSGPGTNEVILNIGYE